MARSLVSGFLSIAGGRVAILLAGIIFTPLLVRILGPASYGRYALILSVFAFANFIMGSGTNDAIRKFISEQDNAEWQIAVFGFIARLAAGLGLFVSVSLTLGAATGVVERIFGSEYVVLFYILAVYSLSRQGMDFLIKALMGLKLENYSEPIKVLQRALFVTSALTAAYLGYGVAGVLVAQIATATFAFLIALFVLSHRLDITSSLTNPQVPLPRKTIYSYTTSTVIFFGLLMSLYHVDVLILQQYESEQTVGYYKGALVIAETLWIIPGSLQLALLQRTSNLWDDGKLNAIQRRASATTRFSLGFTVLVVLGMAALADAFVPLYLGEDFRPTVTPLLLLLPGVIGFATARPSLAINQARRSLRPLIAATAGCAAVNLTLNLLLIPQYGMVGAAVATSIGYGSLVVFQALAARLLGYSPFADARLLRIGIVATISSIPIFGLASILPPRISLLIVPLVGFAVYSITAISTGVVSSNEINSILSRLPQSVERKLGSVIDAIPRFYSAGRAD